LEQAIARGDELFLHDGTGDEGTDSSDSDPSPLIRPAPKASAAAADTSSVVMVVRANPTRDVVGKWSDNHTVRELIEGTALTLNITRNKMVIFSDVECDDRCRLEEMADHNEEMAISDVERDSPNFTVFIPSMDYYRFVFRTFRKGGSDDDCDPVAFDEDITLFDSNSTVENLRCEFVRVFGATRWGQARLQLERWPDESPKVTTVVEEIKLCNLPADVPLYRIFDGMLNDPKVLTNLDCTFCDFDFVAGDGITEATIYLHIDE
jgi:hypothetical protein